MLNHSEETPDSTEQAAGDSGAAKQDYDSPVLTRHGDAGELTLGRAGVGTEGGRHARTNS